ncbi:MAG: hypothetical protein ACR2IH_02940 [Pyrinomonadaceae bacterium]
MGLGFSFYFADALWDKLKDKAHVCCGIEKLPYRMRECVVYDNNGYLLQFGQPIEQAGN